MHDGPDRLAAHWLQAFESALQRADREALAALFAEDCYWRDLLAFTWNLKTVEGRAGVLDMLDAVLASTAPCNWVAEHGTATGDAHGLEAWFTFETATARGTGHLRLRQGRCWTLLTTMTELKGFEERRGPRRALGLEHRARRDRLTWLEQRRREQAELGASRQPYCVIVGGGQGGIALAARLRRLDVPTLVVDRLERPGDFWRQRYRSLVLHDPVWYDHLPYLPFPDHWPVFTPKDKMADWLEAYCSIMELNYWGSTRCVGAGYDATRAEWEVRVERAGETLTLRPRQLVIATGAYGFARVPTLEGAAGFRGETLHSSAYRDGSAYRGKRCVVIGSGSSAHDLCVDLWENDAEVTMVQRSSSIVVRSETLMEVGFGPLYSEEAVARGLTTERADLLFASMPFRLLPDFQRPLYEEIARRDADFYERLTAAGFAWDFGVDGSGLLMKALRTAAGYYIDVGACSLIADGSIELRSGRAVAGFTANGVRLDDGEELPADLVVFATGYGSLDEVVAQLISPEVAERIGPFWGYGSGTPGDPGPWEGELRNMWKPTRQEALWFHGGNLHLSRHYSLYVALQIKARMEGLPTPVYW